MMTDAISASLANRNLAPKALADDARRTTGEDASIFSYAFAAASAEKSAAQSLKVHGGAPAQTEIAPASAAAAQSAASVREAAPAKPAAEMGAKAPATPAASLATKPATTPIIAAASIQPSSQTGAAPIAPPPANAATAGIKPGAAAAAEAAAARRPAAAKAAQTAPGPSSAREAFAEILARRLEKTSVFDLRLDPPAFGRVEGRLAIEDGGKAVLSLTFDNQAAYDRFSRDETALRTALAESGLDFSAGDFVFAFRERAETPMTEARIAPTDTGPAASARTSRHHGAIDIRV